MKNNFNKIDKTIRKYIKLTLTTNCEISEFVPNTHVAEVFKDILIYSELEDNNQKVFNNVKDNPYDSIGNNNPDDYEKQEDGRYIKKKTYSVGINNLLISEYFDLNRLKIDAVKEIYRTYQKLRDKRDEVRNKILMGRIVLPYNYTNRNLTKSHKIKISCTHNKNQ
jgi:hypothetical protein